MSNLWDGGDLTYNNVASTNFPSSPFDIEAMAEMMRAFKVKDALRKSRAYFDVLTIEPCRVCGEKIEYKEGPPEHYEMCGHMMAELKRQYPPPESVAGNPAGPFPDMMGMPIYLKSQ